MSGSSGCATARSRPRSISSPSISCRTGRTSRSRRAGGPPCRAIRRQVVAAFPGKEILLGEFGWPSAGRMREGALPSPVNQARVLHEVLALAKRENYRVNLIEAYDQPWKRQLEGTVGGHWGLYDAYGARPSSPGARRCPTIRIGAGRRRAASAWPRSFLPPRWRRRCGDPRPSAQVWLAVAGIAAVSGTLIGWTIANVPLESLDRRRLDALAGLGGGGARRAGRAAAALVSGVGGAELCAVLGRRAQRAARSARARARRAADRARRAGGAGGARPGVRSALPRLSLRAADRRGRPVPAADGGRGRAAGPAPAPRPWRRHCWRCRRSTSCSTKRVANWQALWFCGGLLALALSLLAGAGRARLRMSSAAARPASPALCSTSPKPAAASATDISRIDGRTRLSSGGDERHPAETPLL